MPSFVPSVLLGRLEFKPHFWKLQSPLPTNTNTGLYFFMLEAKSTLSCPFMKIQKGGVPRLGLIFIYFVILCFCD
jgi:hypothetical protein